MKILSINDFTTKLLSKLLSDLFKGVHLKGTKKLDSKVIHRQYFHRKTGLYLLPANLNLAHIKCM